jgi:Asp-tRNA(Asn)/Glu-tRNA(Gln) amidotransferase A subunit family amidase
VIQPNRRDWMIKLSAIGIGSVAFQRVLAHKASVSGVITAQMINDAQWIADIELTDAEKEVLAKQVQEQSENERRLRALKIDADTGPAMAFLPHFFAEHLPEDRIEIDNRAGNTAARALDPSWSERTKQNHSGAIDWLDELSVAATGIIDQAEALRTGKLTSQRLTELYLSRLKKFDPVLRCVVTLTEELALQQARQADKELKEGKDRGLLHGIPWGAKDIIAVPPFPTTWGARPYSDTVRVNLATVAARLNEAGAVMLGKLSVGTLAMGDVWHEATTKNPWNVEQGSSGSSAGSSSAVAAGLCTFALGTETLGSIVSPTRRCRVMGLRPSFGRVSRYGCMTLAWSMDKVGPIARHAIDCGIVLNAIQGTDGLDPTVVDRPFIWPTAFDVKKLRVGFIESQLSESERIVLDQLKSDGAKLIPIEFPETIPLGALMIGLDVESAAMHDPLFRTAELDSDMGLWGPSFRKSQFARGIPYVQSMRARTLLIQETERVLRRVDVLLGSDDLVRTNLSGHPSMVVRFGSQELTPATRSRETVENAGGKPKPVVLAPRVIKLTAKFFGDAWLVAVADYIERQLPAKPELPSMHRN